MHYVFSIPFLGRPYWYQPSTIFHEVSYIFISQIQKYTTKMSITYPYITISGLRKKYPFFPLMFCCFWHPNQCTRVHRLFEKRTIFTRVLVHATFEYKCPPRLVDCLVLVVYSMDWLFWKQFPHITPSARTALPSESRRITTSKKNGIMGYFGGKH